MCDVELDGRALGLQSSYVHVKTDDLYRPNARFTPERLGYQVLTPFGKLGYSQIIELLKTEGEVWASFVEGVSEDFLAEPFAMPPGATPASKSRFEMLLSVKEHEMHHRGQLMVAQRALGIVPHLTRLRQEQMAQSQSASSGS